MSLPEITHLQFVILEALNSGACSGQAVREALLKHKINKSGPAFYQLMGRLEDAGLVTGWYVEQQIDGQRIKERHYKLTGKGVRELERTIAFYSELQLSAQGGLAHGNC